MGKNTKIWIVVLLILGAGLWYVQQSKSGRQSSYQEIFTHERDVVYGVEIRKRDDRITLAKEGDVWKIVGQDSLEVRQNRLDDLFNQVLAVQRGTVMTTESSRWETYAVGDSTGTHLTVKDASGGTLGEFVFGQSKTDWGRNYVRVKPEPSVYLTDKNITFYLNPSAMYWGETPQPPIAPSDSVRVEVDPPVPVSAPE